ncbi:FxsA cytoplasmic membrane protein OS=Tsukamurella paurometabola (strain ATCC 8368 / DSM / CCUG 35730 / CIP 100753 / JCM 10117 / KCTC 9821 / NBRC 16120 /NCIMB 702349 / NCTC 13040) OX=521096 GN=Tpau_2197 PE=4 SV=1 [Tsukamurella paurometabola]|uniref:FxsA cytoplasmic membrane protein n=2 Tax=Tsukamurella paurometabola TaxID=2061 RepID=D5UPQ0_TSUPD|nr:FxsA cytoplasmic membrane protein [Tsukamurella paurometabola DSM 20162]SUP33203.1 phage T7 F exclusion suppressor FxsA [Tsukamurella paurometabola]
MKLLAFLTYLVVEIAAFAGLVAWLRFGWALLTVVAATAIGVLMLRRTAADVLRDLGAALDGRKSAGPALIDTALLGSSVFLLAVPGVVSTALGLLLLVRPVRAVVRPVAAYVGAKRISRFVEESGLVTVLAGQPRGFGTVIDGSVDDRATDGRGARSEPVVDGVVMDAGAPGGPRPGYRELPPA